MASPSRREPNSLKSPNAVPVKGSSSICDPEHIIAAMYDPFNYEQGPPKLSLEPASVTPSVAESNASNSPPLTRGSSPDLSLSLTPAIYACPPLGRSFSSAASSESSTYSVSTFSQPSATSRSSSASAALRQRGYVRPQGVTFAQSAGKRDSVLSLGSIAHLQYYFARTGLLEGKGGQLAKDNRGKPGYKFDTETQPRIYVPPDVSSDHGNDSMSEAGQSEQDLEEPLMLPPTVSTYSHRQQYIEPPPDPEKLRNDLVKAIDDAKKALQQVSDEKAENQAKQVPGGDETSITPIDENTAPTAFSQSSGWYEIQGMHILDVVTLAIRAAKIYYMSHGDPQRLYSIKSERHIREELLGIMDVLKRMAARNFAGGMRSDELNVIRGWVDGIEGFIASEKALEQQATKEREGWQWLDGSWEGREREREQLFLNSFNPVEPLPEWTAVDSANPKATPFLTALTSGLTLVHLHNALLKKSRRTFGEIKTFHTDTAKPYRCAENLRYWIKSAELRWETKLKVNASAVMNGKDEAWSDFDAAILQWSRTVREELTKEWKDSAIYQFPEVPAPGPYQDRQSAEAERL